MELGEISPYYRLLLGPKPVAEGRQCPKVGEKAVQRRGECGPELVVLQIQLLQSYKLALRPLFTTTTSRSSGSSSSNISNKVMTESQDLQVFHHGDDGGDGSQLVGVDLELFNGKRGGEKEVGW